MARLVATIFILLTPLFACATDNAIAETDYKLHCQGCHLPEGAGARGAVPRMKNFLGIFLHSDAGREFIVQVPGAATTNLSDKRLANLLNWMLITWSADELPSDFVPYSENEVARLRADIQVDPDGARKNILAAIAGADAELAARLEQDDGY